MIVSKQNLDIFGTSRSCSLFLRLLRKNLRHVSVRKQSIWLDERVVKDFVSRAQKNLNIKRVEDWYQVRRTDIEEQGGRGLLQLHKGSYINAISSLFPHHQWKIWKFVHAPASIWKNEQLQREYLQDLAEELKLRAPDDWYKVTLQNFKEHNGAELARLYRNDLPSLFTKLLPNINWKDWRFNVKMSETESISTWKNLETLRECLDLIGAELGFKSLEDWYQVSQTEVTSLDGFQNFAPAIVATYGSLENALKSAYSDYSWRDWRFIGTHDSHRWDEVRNKREFLEDLAKALNYQSWQDYYALDPVQVRRFGGSGLLTRTDNSLYGLLSAALPDHPWRAWRFKHQSTLGFLSDKSKHRVYFDELAEDLGIVKKEDWYNVSSVEVSEFPLLGCYNKSLIRALKSVYSDYPWQVWRFASVSRNYWDDPKNVREFIEYAEKEFNIKILDDWYKVTSKQFKNIGGSALLQKYGQLSNVLGTFYPKHNWDWSGKLARSKTKTQTSLFDTVKKLLPDVDVFLEHLHPSLKVNNGQRSLIF
eukprot:TRINITY_DN4492_c0_g1_i1.p1 TRINITY_DN4492_c0_g1~~TRINITY_DN4492_c0_g1_i1.p1  ORF type:complete len:534 (-),score=111.87 TRINITY_DN4492_c0_g1_i1:429-2030(-)